MGVIGGLGLRHNLTTFQGSLTNSGGSLGLLLVVVKVPGVGGMGHVLCISVDCVGERTCLLGHGVTI